MFKCEYSQVLRFKESMEQQPKFTENREIIEFLSEKFPACFSVSGDAKPLKIGLFQELIADPTLNEKVSNTRLRQALRHYTSSIRYLSSVKEDALRADLNGETEEKVLAEHAEYAQERLAVIKTKLAERKKAQEEAKAADKPAKRKQAFKANKPAKKDKPAAKSATPKTETKKITVGEQVAADQLKVDQAVNILIGSNLVAATVNEINKDFVRVLLQSGMTVEVAITRVFIA